MAELPTAEYWLARGDVAMARECITKSKRLPPLREIDTWVMQLWKECCSRLGAGSQIQLLRWRCELAGFTEPATVEIWTRMMLVEETVQDYVARVRAAENA